MSDDEVEAPTKPRNRARGVKRTRKDPRAPKRSKSAYIFFAMDRRETVKTMLPERARVGDIAKKTSELWKALTDEEREKWENIATADRERYQEEKSNYSGPLLIQGDRADGRGAKTPRDPDQPKRPLTAFLYYCQAHRPQLKKDNPTWGIAELSKQLGQEWRDMNEKEREPYTAHEAKERERYAVVNAEYKKKKEDEAKLAAVEEAKVEKRKKIKVKKEVVKSPRSPGSRKKSPGGPGGYPEENYSSPGAVGRNMMMMGSRGPPPPHYPPPPHSKMRMMPQGPPPPPRGGHHGGGPPMPPGMHDYYRGQPMGPPDMGPRDMGPRGGSAGPRPPHEDDGYASMGPPPGMYGGPPPGYGGDPHHGYGAGGPPPPYADAYGPPQDPYGYGGYPGPGAHLAAGYGYSGDPAMMGGSPGYGPDPGHGPPHGYGGYMGGYGS